MRENAEILRIKADPHSPPRFRIMGSVVNQPGFYAAFGVKPGDAMYRPPSSASRFGDGERASVAALAAPRLRNCVRGSRSPQASVLSACASPAEPRLLSESFVSRSRRCRHRSRCRPAPPARGRAPARGARVRSRSARSPPAADLGDYGVRLLRAFAAGAHSALSTLRFACRAAAARRPPPATSHSPPDRRQTRRRVPDARCRTRRLRCAARCRSCDTSTTAPA